MTMPQISLNNAGEVTNFEELHQWSMDNNVTYNSLVHRMHCYQANWLEDPALMVFSLVKLSEVLLDRQHEMTTGSPRVYANRAANMAAYRAQVRNTHDESTPLLPP